MSKRVLSFGGGEVAVPAAGRRPTSLPANLADHGDRWVIEAIVDLGP